MAKNLMIQGTMSNAGKSIITAGILRFLISLLKTPYCTGIGQVTSSLYQFLTVNIMFNKNFAIDKTGKVLEK